MKHLSHRQQMGKLAYLLRTKHQISWTMIADLTGYSDPGNCLRGAKRYADKFGFEFPKQTHCPAIPPKDLFTLGQLARLRQVIILKKKES